MASISAPEGSMIIFLDSEITFDLYGESPMTPGISKFGSLYQLFAEERKVDRTMRQLSALSIRQPYVEQILRGTKKIEYRSMHEQARARVCLCEYDAGATEAVERN
jgi:hypothetical protein